MAKLTINKSNLRKVQSTIRKEIIKSLRDDDIRKEIGKAIVQDIKDNPVGPPAEATLEWRRRYDQLNITDPAYKRSQINFTFTGELLADLLNNIKLSTKDGISYIVENSKKLHKKYRKKKGTIGKSRSSFSEIAEGLRGHGYTYPDISEKARKSIVKKIRETILEKLKQTFKVK